MVNSSVKDVLHLCIVNLTGLDKAVQASFPKSVHQICIVHQFRNTLKYVSYKDRKAIIKDIYQASNPEIVVEAFEKLKKP